MIGFLSRLFVIGAFIMIATAPLFADAAPKSFTAVELEYDAGWLERVDTILLQIMQNQADTFRTQAADDHSPPWFISGSREREHLLIQNGWRMRLAIVLGTDTLFTPELTDPGHKSFFRFHVGNSGLGDRSPITHTYWLDYLSALIITIGLEVLIAWIFFRIWNWPRIQLWAVVVANLITHPLLWLWLFGSAINGPYTLFWAEGAVVLAEATILSILLKPRPGFGRPFVMSIVLNTISFIGGGILYFFWLVLQPR